MAVPAIAASTCSHRPCSSAIARICRDGRQIWTEHRYTPLYAANGELSAAILDDGRHGELACAVEPDRVVRATVELEECVTIPARAVAKI